VQFTLLALVLPSGIVMAVKHLSGVVFGHEWVLRE